MVSFTAGFICAIFLGGSLIGTDGAITDIILVVGPNVAVTSALAGSAADDKATTLTLAENFAAETLITTLTIVGATPPLTWTIATTANVGLLTVNVGEVVNEGEVALAANKSFDFETSPLVTSVITAVDDADPKLTATVTLTLSVTNVDDNVPVFNPDNYAVTIVNGSAAGKELVTVTATDADGDIIAYSLNAGNTNSDWTIGGTTGTIAVATGKTIEEASYSLVVLATSGTPAKTASATVAVTVDNDPVFNTDNYPVTIAKGSAEGKELVIVTATDADGDVIAYSLSTGNTNSDWTIGGTTGTIVVATGKTIEEASYSLVVIATSGTPAKTDSATVAVTVNSGAVFGVSLMALFGIILMQLV